MLQLIGLDGDSLMVTVYGCFWFMRCWFINLDRNLVTRVMLWWMLLLDSVSRSSLCLYVATSLNDFTPISLGVHWILTLFCYVLDVIGASTVYGMFLVLSGIRGFWHNCILVLVSSGLGLIRCLVKLDVDFYLDCYSVSG